jgi:IS30 family transposase
MKSFKQLSYHEREKIYRGLCDRRTNKEIAQMLDRPESTISREIRRNSDRIGYLWPIDATKKAEKRRHKNKPKIINNKGLMDYIITKLHDRWSPNAIANSWNKTNDVTISKEAIYQWIYTKDAEVLKLRKLLVRAHKRRGFKRKPSGSKIKNRVSIHVRPYNINQRLEAGHYECDLMFNSGNQSKNICTFIERITRKAFLIYNENKSTQTVIDALIKRISDEGLVVKSITFDNGTEFADHSRLNELGISTYFCDPGKPWQKGGIENLNGILRRFLPFELAAADITEAYVEKINNMINRMPRDILSWETPLDKFNELFNSFELKESREKSALPAAEAIPFYQNNLDIAFHC